MSMIRAGLGFALALHLHACGNGDMPIDKFASLKTQNGDACTVLKQQEVEQVLGHSAEAGIAQNLGSGIRQCAWMSQGIPDFAFQILPQLKGGVRAAAVVGEGFLVLDVPDMGTPAAISVLNPAPASGLQPTVAILALQVGHEVLRLAPLRLGIVEGTPAYERLMDLGKVAAARLR